MHYIDYNERKGNYKYNNRLYHKLKDMGVNLKNKRYINSLKKEKLLVNGCELDNEQKEAIYTDEINTLVVAGAGSGKTLTIVGKIDYLIDRGVDEKDILCISLTNDACNNLKNKISHKVDVLTFHKLALRIISHGKYTICSSNMLSYIVDEYFESVVYNNGDMIDKILDISFKNITYNDFVKTKYFFSLKQTIITFISLFKANGYSVSYFCQLDVNEYHDLLSIIVDIYCLYYQELRSQNMIDFDDMLLLANEKLNNEEVDVHYKYIIIDEFQDTSLVKLNLIKSLQKVTGSKLFVVGDDFQSIYKFTGCNIDIFINFSKYVKYAKTVKLTHTYRNSQQLVDVASHFILKNKYQIYKHIVSSKRRDKPIKIVNYHKYVLNELLDYLMKNGEDNILLLGRNNNDINKYLNDNLTKNGDDIRYKDSDLMIHYLTVHRSKGLESDCVVLLNLYDDILGFPCKLKDSKILYLINKGEKYLYEEERRLFYVALTRTKKDIYLICPLNMSVFIKEIIHDNKKYIEFLNI